MQESPLGDECVLSLDCWNEKVMQVEHSKKPNGFQYTLRLIYTWSRGQSTVVIAVDKYTEMNFSQCQDILYLHSDSILHFVL